MTQSSGVIEESLLEGWAGTKGDQLGRCAPRRAMSGSHHHQGQRTELNLYEGTKKRVSLVRA